MFARMKERRLAKAAAEAKATAEREHAEALGEWKDTIEGIEQALDAAKHYNELWDESQAPIIPKKNEELLYVVTEAELVEIKSRKINYGSTSHGVSIRIAKGVTYRPSVLARQHAGVGGSPQLPSTKALLLLPTRGPCSLAPRQTGPGCGRSSFR